MMMKSYGNETLVHALKALKRRFQINFLCPAQIEENKGEVPCYCKQAPHREIVLVKPFPLICGVSPNSLRLMSLNFLKLMY